MTARLRLLLVALLALTLSLGFVATQNEDAAAYSTGFGISSCSYANGYCVVHIDMWCPSGVHLDWYTMRSGYYTTSWQDYYIGPGAYESSRWIRWDERADYVTISDNGSGCLRGAYLVGVRW